MARYNIKAQTEREETLGNVKLNSPLRDRVNGYDNERFTCERDVKCRNSCGKA